MTYKGKFHMTRPVKYDSLAGFQRWTDEDRYHCRAGVSKGGTRRMPARGSRSGSTAAASSTTTAGSSTAGATRTGRTSIPGLDADPLELVNLGNPEVAGKLPPDLREKVARQRQALHEQLTEKLRNRQPDEPHTLANKHTGTLPDEIIWPKISGVSPTATQYEGGVGT